jgi:peptide/nickel transport system substrate-binding protein
VIRKRTGRGLLISGLLLGLGASVSVATALAATSTKGATQSERSTVSDGGTLLIGSPYFDYIDPALLPDPSVTAAVGGPIVAWAAEDATCATLLRYRAGPPLAQDYTLVPEVAAGLPTVSRDGKTYTFRIRKGYRFSTGAPVTARNYAHAIGRVLNPATRSPAKTYLQDVAEVRAAGNRLMIRLTRSVPDLPARMTMPYTCPVPTDLPVDPEGAGAPLPGSGPYYFAEFVRGSRVVLKRNRFYRGSRAHHVDALVFEVGSDANVNVISRRVEAGDLDVDLFVPLARLSELAKKYDVNRRRLFSVPSGNMYYLYMNTERPLFRGNVKLRQAVNFALDRAKLVYSFTDGAPWAASATDDYLPRGLPGYVDAAVYPLKRPDLKKAKALARGHTGDGKAVLYTCDSTTASCLSNAQRIQADLKEIGLDVEIKQFPLAVYFAKFSTRGEPFDLVLDRLLVPWVDPYQYVNRQLDGRTIQATGNTNRSYFSSRYYNLRIDQAGKQSGRARYDAYGRLAVDVARNSAPMAAAFVRNTRFFVSGRVSCVRVSAHGLDLAGLCLN